MDPHIIKRWLCRKRPIDLVFLPKTTCAHLWLAANRRTTTAPPPLLQQYQRKQLNLSPLWQSKTICLHVAMGVSESPFGFLSDSQSQSRITTKTSPTPKQLLRNRLLLKIKLYNIIILVSLCWFCISFFVEKKYEDVLNALWNHYF